MNKLNVYDLIGLNNNNKLNKKILYNVRLNVLRGFYRYYYKINYGDNIISKYYSKEEIINDFENKNIL